MSLSYWESHISDAIERGIQVAFHERDDELRRMIKEAVRESMQYFYGMRKGED